MSANASALPGEQSAGRAQVGPIVAETLFAEIVRHTASGNLLQCLLQRIDIAANRPDQDAEAVFQAMLREGVIIRAMDAYGFPEYIRVNIGLPEENQRFLEALEKVLGSAT